MIACILSRDNMTILVFSSIFPQGKELSATLGTQLFLMIERSFNYLTNTFKEICTFSNTKNFNENPDQAVQIFSSKYSPLLPKCDSKTKPNRKPNQTKKKKIKSTPLTPKNLPDDCLSYFSFRIF